MIELKVEPRCHECPEFEPIVATVNSLYADEPVYGVPKPYKEIYVSTSRPLSHLEIEKMAKANIAITKEPWTKMNPYINKSTIGIMMPAIKDVIFNDPATIVFWSDGTKTVVKCQEDDIYDPEKGLAMAICKKFFGNKGNYCNEINKWTDKYIEKMADEINPFEFAWTSIQKSIMDACDKINSSKATETQPAPTDAPKKQKILATMEFEVDISNLDPEYTNVMEQAKNIARNRLRDLMLKKDINADNFNYEIVITNKE